MHATTCAQIRHWFQQRDPVDTLPAPLIAHLAECAICRGALLLMAEALGGQIERMNMSCEVCQEQLAAYLDAQEEIGIADARQRYPAVAWHLLTCVECAEIYRLLRAVLDAERSGALPPLSALHTIE